MAGLKLVRAEKHCPVCGTEMSPEHAWWWTDKGAVCSERCARDVEWSVQLQRQYEVAVRRNQHAPRED